MRVCQEFSLEIPTLEQCDQIWQNYATLVKC